MNRDLIDIIGFIGIVIIFPMVIIGLFVFGTFFSFMTPGSGQHTGYITATEKYGVIWKTGRAYVKTDTQSSQEDTYCVQDDSIFVALEKAQESKEKVTIKFASPLIMPNWKCGGESSVIVGIN
jgi:hypothetical protein